MGDLIKKLPSLEGLKEVLDNQPSPQPTVITPITLEEHAVDSLIHPNFIVFKQTENMYLISFNINKHSVQSTALFTNLLTLYFYDMLYIYHDCFIDTSTGEISFADTAYKVYEKKVHKKHGMVRCNLCQRIVPETSMNRELGYCKICETVDIPNTTFH
jgi:hypothetical protein